ncbi:MAG: WD40 repeat domain-containing protein, partial [Candidatus Hodarchaeota archaeon]
SSDGNYIITGGLDNTVYLFERSSSTPLWNYTATGQFGDGDRPRCVAISANGNYIAAGSHDYNIYLFEKTNSTPLFNYTTGGEISCIAISENGGYIVAGELNGGIYLLYNDIPSKSKSTQIIPSTNLFILFAVATALIIILVKKKLPKIKVKS